MMPPGASLIGPSANMMPSQSLHHPPAMFNPTATTGYGAYLQGQPPSVTSLNKPPQAGMLPPPPSTTGVGSLQHQFPPPPKAGAQPTVGQPLQQLPPKPNQFPPPPSVGTHPPVGLPPQQVTPVLPKTDAQVVGPNLQSVPMTDQSQPHIGALRQPNQPPIMSTMAGPPLQTSNANQFSGQTIVGAAHAVPPTMSAQQPPPPTMSARQPPPPMISAQQPPPPTMSARQPPPPMMSAQQPPPPTMSAQQPPPPMMSAQQPPPPMMSAQQPPPPIMSAQQPPPPTSTNIASNTGGAPMLGMPSSNIIPQRVNYMSTNLSGPPLSTGTVQAGMPPPPGNLWVL